MATKSKFTIPDSVTFTPVRTSFKVSGGAARNPPQGVLEETGRIDLNTEASNGMDRIADAQEMGRNYHVYFLASQEHGLVEVRIATHAEIPGQMPIRRPDGTRISFHIGGVFEEYPQMRPTEKRECPVVVDEQNQRLVLIIKTAPSSRRRPKTPDPTSGA